MVRRRGGTSRWRARTGSGPLRGPDRSGSGRAESPAFGPEPLHQLDLAGMVGVVLSDADDQFPSRPLLGAGRPPIEMGRRDRRDRVEQHLVLVGQELAVGLPSAFSRRVGLLREVRGRPGEPRPVVALEPAAHRILPIREVQRQLPDGQAARRRTPARLLR